MLVHKHLIVRAEVLQPPRDPTWAEQWLLELINDIGMKVLIGPHSAYVDMPGNKGLTVAAIIETSHIVMHVWDEVNPGLLQLDVYTCGPLKTSIIFDALYNFDPVKIEYKYLDRERNLAEVPLDN